MKSTQVILFGLMLLTACACQASGEDPEATVPVAPTASPTLPPTTVLAKVNGEEILAGDLEGTVKVFLRGQDPTALSPQQIQELRRQLLDSLVSSELLYQASQKAGITVSEKRVDEQIQAIRSRFPTPEEFDQYVENQALSLENMKGRIRRNLATEALVNRELGTEFTPSEEEIEAYYENNKESMRKQESVRLYQIFVEAGAKASPEVKAQARLKAESALAEVMGGKDFAAVARERSESPDAQRGGDMGYVGRPAILPALATAAFSLEVGGLSDIIETPFGFHILKVTDKRPAGGVTLEEARPQISNLVAQVKEQEAFNALVERLKSDAQIEILKPDP